MLDCQQLTLTLTAAPQGPAQVPNLTQGKEEEKVIQDNSKIIMFQTL